MNIEEAAQQAIENFKKKLNEACDEAVGTCYNEIVPHIVSDNSHNTQYRAQAIIMQLLAGNFKRSGREGTVIICDDNGIDTDITISDHQYDNIRDNLIKAMPACPKDLKIKQLQNLLKEAYMNH